MRQGREIQHWRPSHVDDDPENLSAIVDVTGEETGRVIYKVESKGCFYQRV
jgi:hypothetical protein